MSERLEAEDEASWNTAMDRAEEAGESVLQEDDDRYAYEPDEPVQLEPVEEEPAAEEPTEERVGPGELRQRRIREHRG